MTYTHRNESIHYYRQRNTRMSPATAHTDDWSTYCISRGWKESRLLSLEKMKCGGTLSTYINNRWEGERKTEQGLSQSCPETGQEANSTNSSEHKKILLYCEGSQNLEWNVQRGYRVSIHGHTQNTWTSCSSWPIFKQVGLHWVISRGAFQLQLFCDSN